nr:MAG TPA: hypothetical protein [Bacteriophage sp.]
MFFAFGRCCFAKITTRIMREYRSGVLFDFCSKLKGEYL